MNPSSKTEPAKITKAFLLAAGLGTRLRPITDRIPKCMVPIGGRPLCDYWFALCEAHGIRDILMNTHYCPGPVRDYVARMKRDLRVTLVHEERLLGSAGTVRENAAFVQGEDAFLVIYADNLSNADLTRLIAFHRAHPGPLTMAVFRAEHPSQCGIAVTGADGRVLEFVEKPEQPSSDLANAGLYVADVSTLQDLPDMPVCDYGRDVLPHYVGRMFACPLEGYHLDIGTPDAYALAQRTCPPDMPR